MRIWSLHPKYLDAKGIVALWRETLLAKHVLEGMTKGYKSHPQLNRFKETTDPLAAIHVYLSEVYKEALKRGYHFDKSKFNPRLKARKITVTKGQLAYELAHLKRKLKTRDPKKLKLVNAEIKIARHPLFRIINGDKEDWEIITTKSRK